MRPAKHRSDRIALVAKAYFDGFDINTILELARKEFGGKYCRSNLYYDLRYAGVLPNRDKKKRKGKGKGIKEFHPRVILSTKNIRKIIIGWGPLPSYRKHPEAWEKVVYLRSNLIDLWKKLLREGYDTLLTETDNEGDE